MPESVVLFINVASQHSQEKAPKEFQEWHIQNPWRPIPSFVKPKIPKCFDIAFVEEKLLQYNFRNHTHLLEAMTHPSYWQAGGDYQRMAFLGSALTELLILQMLVKSAYIPLHAFNSLSPEATQATETDAHGALWASHEERQWPGLWRTWADSSAEECQDEIAWDG